MNATERRQTFEAAERGLRRAPALEYDHIIAGSG
jgi:hypothetical protein